MFPGAPRVPASLARALAKDPESFAATLHEEAGAQLGETLGSPGAPFGELVRNLPASLAPSAALLAILAQAGPTSWAGREGSRRLALAAFMKVWDHAGEAALLAEAGTDPRALGTLASTVPAFRLRTLAAAPAAAEAASGSEPELLALRGLCFLGLTADHPRYREIATRLWEAPALPSRVLARLIRVCWSAFQAC